MATFASLQDKIEKLEANYRKTWIDGSNESRSRKWGNAEEKEKFVTAMNKKLKNIRDDLEILWKQREDLINEPKREQPKRISKRHEEFPEEKCKHYFEKHDYKNICRHCGLIEDKKVFMASFKTVGYNSWTKKTKKRSQLRQEGKARGIRNVERMRKDDLAKEIELYDSGKKKKEKGILELQAVAKAAGVKRIKTFKKEDLKNKIEETKEKSDFDKLGIKELQDIAKKLGIKQIKTYRKEDLKNKIREKQGKM